MFSEAVCDKIGNYVYRLIDPRNGETFYVGKGKGNRVFQHVKGALKPDGEEDTYSAKIDRIRQIRNANLKVQHVIHRHAISDDAIFDVEAALIDAYPGLTNIAGGHGSSDRGPMHSTEIIARFELPKLTPHPDHKLILINVNQSVNDTSKLKLYDQVRFAWRISKLKAESADYVLAVVRGIVKGAFIAEHWLPATSENFPGFSISEVDKGRMGFVGRKAPPEIQEFYVGQHGKRITTEGMRHVQNPVRYWNISDAETA